MQSFDFKKYLPTILIIVGFFIVSAFFCMPQFQGKVLRQHDIVSWKAMSHEGMEWHEKTGENVLWSNSMFGGMPTYTYYVPENSNYVVGIQKALVEGIGKPAGFFFLAMVSFFILMSVLRMNRWLAAAGAIAYAFATYNPGIINAGHETKMLCVGYMPAVLAGLILIYRQRWWTGIPLLGISLALMIGTGHYQVMYYFLIVILLFIITALVTAIKEGTVKGFFISSLVAALIAAVAIGPSMQTLLPTLEYNKETMRGGQSELTLNHDKDKKSGGLDKDYAFLWSNGIAETFAFLIPDISGGSSFKGPGVESNTYEKLISLGAPEQYAEQMVSGIPMYWGPQPFISGPIYYGAIICFLFVLGLLVVRSRHKWWIIAACAIAIMMSWGDHFKAFNYFLFDTLPMLNKFRTPTIVLTIPQLLFPLLAIWALNDIVQGKLTNEELLKKLKIATIITAGLCILLAFGGSMFFDFQAKRDASVAQQFSQAFNNPQAGAQIMSAVQEDRAALATKSSLISAVYILLAAGLIWAFAKGKIKATPLIAGISLLIAIDLLSEASGYLNEEEHYVEEEQYDTQFQPRPVDLQIMQDKDPYYRVLDLTRDTYQDAIQAYFHKCVGGYSPAKMERYQDLIDVHLSQKLNGQVLSMLNTKYIIAGQGEQPVVYPNQGACGNAWFVNNIKWVNTADEEMLSMNAPGLGDTAIVPDAFDPKTTAIIRNNFKNEVGNAPIGKDSAASIKLTKYGLNDLSFQSTNSQAGLGVFSDMYYPHGWTAYVDGKETPIIKANYVLRAIRIPAGTHKIDFKFHPSSFYTGDTIALICSILLYLMAAIGIYMIFKKGNEPEVKNG
jgi:hypothetical protein